MPLKSGLPVTHGADVVGLEEAAAELDAAAELLLAMKLQLTQRIMFTVAWRGPDADRFRQGWMTQHSLQLLVTAMSLEQAATQLRQHAAEQQDASAPSGFEQPGVISAIAAKLGVVNDINRLRDAATVLGLDYEKLDRLIPADGVLARGLRQGKNLAQLAGRSLTRLGLALDVHDVYQGVKDGDWEKVADVAVPIGAAGAAVLSGGSVVVVAGVGLGAEGLWHGGKWYYRQAQDPSFVPRTVSNMRENPALFTASPLLALATSSAKAAVDIHRSDSPIDSPSMPIPANTPEQVNNDEEPPPIR